MSKQMKTTQKEKMEGKKNLSFQRNTKDSEKRQTGSSKNVASH